MASNLIWNGVRLVVPLVAALALSCSVQPAPSPLNTPSAPPPPAASQAQTTYRLQVLTDPIDRVSVASSPTSADGRYAAGVVVELTATCAEDTVHWRTTSLGRGVVETITNQPVTTLSVTMNKDQVVFVRCTGPRTP
ncbi:MAG: hypothetical protein EXR47_04985 [Dehalococcoidia bacterium]|nr:hypothetical protein [Dehalococcoidia bacterium]